MFYSVDILFIRYFMEESFSLEINNGISILTKNTKQTVGEWRRWKSLQYSLRHLDFSSFYSLFLVSTFLQIMKGWALPTTSRLKVTAWSRSLLLTFISPSQPFSFSSSGIYFVHSYVVGFFVILYNIILLVGSLPMVSPSRVAYTFFSCIFYHFFFVLSSFVLHPARVRNLSSHWRISFLLFSVEI